MTTGDKLAPRDLQLGPRQSAVARHIAAGGTNRDVAQALGISIFTVASYLRQIYARLGVHSRAEMVAKLAEQPVWSESLVQDVTTNVIRSLASAGVQVTREQVRDALAAAGIEPGAVR